MKTILLLILSAFTAFAATTYPVLTDNANRTFTGGATNLALLNATNRFTGPLQLPSVTAGRVPIIDAGGNLTNSAVTPTALGYLDATSSVQTQLDSKPTVALTNLALLNGTNVFTGTNTFNTNTVLGSSNLQTLLDSKPTLAATNVAQLNQSQNWTGTPTFPLTFFSSNGIRERLLYNTNVFVPTVVYATNSALAGSPTNAGESIHATVIADFDLPALATTNSTVCFTFGFSTTNVNAERSGLAIYCGTNTNCVFWSQSYTGNGSSPWMITDLGSRRPLFSNFGSFTNQLTGRNPSTSTQTYPTFQSGLTGFYLLDTSTNWNIKFALAAFTTKPNTNFQCFIRVFELID